MSVLEQVQDDARTAMKARERDKASALRLVVDALQQDAKMGKGDEVAVLQRERKKRVEAAEAFEGAGRTEQAAAERFEAELIEGYLPAQLSDEELEGLVAEAVAETGATEQKQMGQVMSAVMPKVAGRADGKRVSAAVRKKLGAELGPPPADSRQRGGRRARRLRGLGPARAARPPAGGSPPARQRADPGRRRRATCRRPRQWSTRWSS